MIDIKTASAAELRAEAERLRERIRQTVTMIVTLDNLATFKEAREHHTSQTAAGAGSTV
jgi:transposase